MTRTAPTLTENKEAGLQSSFVLDLYFLSTQDMQRASGVRSTRQLSSTQWLLVTVSIFHASHASSKLTERFTRARELLKIHSELRGTSDQLVSRVQKAIDSKVIPPIIHQTWKTHELPPLLSNWSASWKAKHPEWLHVVWSDEDNQRLIEEHYPSFMASYLGLEANISRADAIRPAILHRYGGVYADMDQEALKPLDELLEGKQMVLAQMGKNKNLNSIPNAFMAAVEGHRFLQQFMRSINHTSARNPHAAVEVIAGPIALKRVYDSFVSKSRNADVVLLAPGVIFPVDWSVKRLGEVAPECDFGGHPDLFDAAGCIARHFPDAYSVQWWAHTWSGKGAERLKGRNLPR